jgi:predicted Zn-dependent protease
MNTSHNRVFEATLIVAEGNERQACTVSLVHNNLHIYVSEPRQELIIWDLRKILSCEWQGYTLRLKHTKAELECSGEVAKAIHEAVKHPVIPEEAPVAIKLIPYLPILITLLVLLFAGILTYRYALPWMSRKAVSLIPVEAEVEMGEALSKQYTLQYKSNDSVNFYLKQFCRELNFNSPYPIKVEVLMEKEINAFALPGGRIFVYEGILNKMHSYGELVALLGHEASHVTQRHSLKSMAGQAASGLIISTLFGDVSGLSTWVLSKADEFKQLHYSRELETEADSEGLNLMRRNGINPQYMLHLLVLLRKESEEMPALMQYMNTHPDTDARIVNVFSRINKSESYLVNKELEVCFKQIQRQLSR